MQSEELKKLKKELFEARLAYEYSKMDQEPDKIIESKKNCDEIRNQIKQEMRNEIEKEKENTHARH